MQEPFHARQLQRHSVRFMQNRIMYVTAWAGEDVAISELHPPYNLLLRLLFELCSDIVVQPGPVVIGDPDAGDAAAVAQATFDPEELPCSTGTGFTSDCKVVLQTASNTTVEVSTVPEALCWHASVSCVLHARCNTCVTADARQNEACAAASLLAASALLWEHDKRLILLCAGWRAALHSAAAALRGCEAPDVTRHWRGWAGAFVERVDLWSHAPGAICADWGGVA